jgi:hypothetical protein
VSRFGELVGIEGIAPSRALEALPFSLVRPSFASKSGTDPGSRDVRVTGGLDLRYGVSPGISLNATVNPDFGQVEADPAVLNLGVFETFFPERRPFFTEGSDVYEYSGPDITATDGPAQLFHSRRIGRQPERFKEPDGTGIVDQPDNTTILGAAKVSGKTAGGLSLGFVEAVTDEEFAVVAREADGPAGPEGERLRHKLEPVTNYLVGRLQQDVLESSHVGALFTAVNGAGIDPAYVGSVDGELNLRDRTAKLFTRWTGSHTHDDKGLRKRGYEGALFLAKRGGVFGGELYADTRSPGFDVNDLGFMDRAGRTQLGAWGYARIRKPYFFAWESEFNWDVWQHWNDEGYPLSKGWSYNMWHTLRNYWWWGVGADRKLETFDDLVTRGGPVMVDPARWKAFFSAGSDERKPVRFDFNADLSRDDYGASFRQSYSLGMGVRPSPRAELNINFSYSRGKDFAQWVENVDDDGDGEDDHFVFGELNSRTFDVRTRAHYAFTPNASIQVFLQQFVSTGDYGEIKELAAPKSFLFRPYGGLDRNPDFSSRSMRSNLVFRWEYRPGSTLFVVWQRTRDADFDVDNPDFKPWRGIWGALGDRGDNVFLLKVSYLVGL